MEARTSATGAQRTEFDQFSEAAAVVSPTPSFADIYRKYFDFVWTSARSLGIGTDAIDDVMQEVFVVVHSRVHTLREPDALRSWIYGVVRRTAFAHLRAQRHRNSSVAEYYDDTYRVQSTPAELNDHSDQAKLLWRLLEKLDDSKREVFVMAELAEMTIPEIAQALDIPLGTASTRLRAARKAFDTALARHNSSQTSGGH